MSLIAKGAATARPGRPRSEEREREILEATLVALVEDGFDAMTMEGVAARVGAGKATLYRRWQNKAELVAHAIRQHVAPRPRPTDTGDIRTDLRTLIDALYLGYSGTDGRLIAAFTAERMRHPELAAEFDRQFLDERRAHTRSLLHSAVIHGQLPADSDVDLLSNVVPALMLYYLTFDKDGLTNDLVERIIRQFFPTAL